MSRFDIAVLGLGVMGGNLALNLISKGFNVVGWDSSSTWHEAKPELLHNANFQAPEKLEDVVDLLNVPRKILLFVPAGDPVSETVARLSEILHPNDILVDCGNSHYLDSIDRERAAWLDQVHFVGLGVSGGASGALNGPSMMYGGSEQAWKELSPILMKIATEGESGPCVHRFGGAGAGHFVKMVHNGIEYADMQIIAEAHDLMSRGLNMSQADQSEFFRKATKGSLSSFLIELAGRVLDSETTDLDNIIDAAEQKGTGSWSVKAALELGVSTPCIDAAVGARLVSSFWAERQQLASVLSISANESPPLSFELYQLEQAIWFAKICAYIQGFDLIKQGSQVYGWNIQIADLVRVWSHGCIIRGSILNLLFSHSDGSPGEKAIDISEVRNSLLESVPAARVIAQLAMKASIPIPAITGALTWFDSISSARLPHAITQAQRDAFGGHGIRLFADPDIKTHGEW